MALPEWAEVLERNPSNRDRFLAQDRDAFIATFERWMAATAPAATSSSPPSPDDTARASPSPALVLRSGARTSTTAGRPPSRWRRCCRTPSWSSPVGAATEWVERQAARNAGEAPACSCAGLLAPMLDDGPHHLP